MKGPDREEQRAIVRNWEETGRVLERLRREALREKSYDWREVDALLKLGAAYPGPPRAASGLVEMQAWFIKAVRSGKIKPMPPRRIERNDGESTAR